jgi:Ca2+-binding EF-hand superfamily protein
MQTFDRLDKDRSGTLEVGELECVLKGIVGDDEVKQILVKADTNGDGVISRSEFLAAVQAESL